ncbi:MAG: Calx-beta domain-containing protein, partial [Betaproteobacteria bacterium]
DSLFIHEVGHNMGNAHDRATAAAQGNGTPGEGAFPYSFGYYFCANTTLTCNPFVPGGCPTTLPQCAFPSNNDIGTIMSYFDPVTLKFSNPAVLCAPAGGGPTSRPCGITEADANNSANNALSMNNMRLTLQGVKATQIVTPPGALQFSQNNYTALETAGTATIPVSRIGGSVGSVSVSYATSDSTAKAGFDYTATSGTLTWANGDTADKIISVPLVNDGVTEGGEAFRVTLSNPTGATGVFLGNPVVVAVQISENTPWPPGNTFTPVPPGYSTPGSSSGIWSLESTASNCKPGNSPCVRSPMVQSTDQQVFASSDLNYSSNNMPAGAVSFDYRVSSFDTSFGYLELLIDNNVVFSSEGGETGWLSTSVPITAGAHTLVWRYNDRLDFPCSGLVAGCADRAWIDNVVVPVSVAVSSTALTSSANPSIAGQSITFTATVSGGAGTPAGVVTFRDGGVIIPGCNLVVMAAAVAQCTTSGLAQGARSITAAYSGNTTYDVSTSNTLIQTVNPSSFLLTVAKAGTGSGEVTSNPAGINTAIADNTETYNAGTPVTLTAAPQGGSTFASWSGGGCSGSGGCIVTMNAATTVTATFNIVQTAPGAPAIGAATPGNTVATIAFTPPVSDGGSPILDYTVTCNVGGFTATGPGSPLTVTGLTNTVGYTCSVTARNAIGSGPASATVPVTPQAGAALALVAVQSRKTHTGIGPFDLAITPGIPIAGLVSVEPRNIGAGHSIVFQFNNTVNVAGTVTAVDTLNAPIGSPTAVMAGNELIVTLTGVPNGKRVTVTLAGVNNSFGTSVSMGFLLGDVNGTRAVNASDISSVKRQVGQPITNGNFRFDLNATGAINSSDVSIAKARSGVVLP